MSKRVRNALKGLALISVVVATPAQAADAPSIGVAPPAPPLLALAHRGLRATEPQTVHGAADYRRGRPPGHRIYPNLWPRSLAV